MLRCVRVLSLATAFLLGGCASTMTTQVTSFHHLTPGSLQGQRFVIIPSAEQQASLEFGTYAGYVREALVGKGLVDAGDAAGRGADLGVTLSYEVNGRASGYREGTGGFAGFGVGSGGYSTSGVGIGIGFPIAIGSGSSESVVYQRSLAVQIDRLSGRSDPGVGDAGRIDPAAPAAAPAAGAAPSGSRVFEARAISEGQSASLAPVMRPMVQAIFEDFPGASGKTRVVQSEVGETR